MSDIQQLIRDGRALLEKATAGPWDPDSWGPIGTEDGPWVHQALGPQHDDNEDGDSEQAQANAAADASLIAWSRNHLPLLLDALETAQQRCEPKQHWQSYMAPPKSDGTCDYFWDTGTEETP